MNNTKLKLYPLGNLNLYFISSASYLHETDNKNFIFSQAAGFSPVKNLWLETSGTFGDLSDYIESDGLYIYNTFDATKLKLGQTVYYQANVHIMLQLNYLYEKKQDAKFKPLQKLFLHFRHSLEYFFYFGQLQFFEDVQLSGLF